jgi:hypothetical protein
MIHVVLGAFVRARVADFRAELADALGEVATARHFIGGKCAGVGARPVQLDAVRERLHVVFLQAGARAMLARGDAVLTRFDAMLVFFVRHDDFLR